MCPQLTVHNTGVSLLLSTSVWVLLSPPIERQRLDQRLNVPVHGRCGERRSPKVQPSTRQGLEPGTSRLAVRDLTNCANLAHTLHLFSTKSKIYLVSVSFFSASLSCTKKVCKSLLDFSFCFSLCLTRIEVVTS